MARITGVKTVKKERIIALIGKMKSDYLVLPSFQRDFVWKPEQKAKLIESVIRNYPIGTFMLLPCVHNKDLGICSFVKQDSDKIDKPMFYVIDGQQRLRTFLELINPPRGFYPTKKIEFGNKEYKFFINVDTNPSRLPTNIEKPSFVVPKKYHVTEEIDNYEDQGAELLMPIEFILSTRHIKKWFGLAFKKARSVNVKKWRRNVLEISKRMRSYQCPVESLSMKLSPEDHTNIFTLLNEGGTDLTTFDQLSAKLHRSDVKLRDLWKDARKEHPLFDEYHIDPIYILKVLVLIKKTQIGTGGLACKKRDIERIYENYKDQEGSVLAKEFTKDWGTACKYTSRALESIQSDFGVPQNKYIPYTPMIIVLAAIKWYANEYKNYDERYMGVIKKKINKWYWRAIFNKLYEKNSDEQVSKHFEALVDWVAPQAGKRTPSAFSFSSNRKDFVRTVKEIESGGDARYKAILCLPLINHAKDLFSYDCLSNAELHDHHIYPKRCKDFRDIIDPSDLNVIFNRMLISDKTNGEILNKSPYDYLKGLSPSILRRHYLFKEITEDRLSFQQFIKLRRKKIVDVLWKLISNGEMPTI